MEVFFFFLKHRVFIHKRKSTTLVEFIEIIAQAKARFRHIVNLSIEISSDVYTQEVLT